jgi:hypothetical protein
LEVWEDDRGKRIAIGTLRTDIKRIYSKLDAHSRFEAISNAKELNLFSKLPINEQRKSPF